MYVYIYMYIYICIVYRYIQYYIIWCIDIERICIFMYACMHACIYIHTCSRIHTVCGSGSEHPNIVGQDFKKQHCRSLSWDSACSGLGCHGAKLFRTPRLMLIMGGDCILQNKFIFGAWYLKATSDSRVHVVWMIRSTLRTTFRFELARQCEYCKKDNQRSSTLAPHPDA